MSQRNRRVLAVAGLAAMLFAAPVPAQAAGLWEMEGAALVARAWSWLEGFSLAPRRAAPARRQPVVRGEAKYFQGSATDPGGSMSRLASSSDSDLRSDQGSAIDPNGSWW